MWACGIDDIWTLIARIAYERYRVREKNRSILQNGINADHVQFAAEDDWTSEKDPYQKFQRPLAVNFSSNPKFLAIV